MNQFKLSLHWKNVNLQTQAPHADSGRRMRVLAILSVLLLVGLSFANLTERRENRYLQSRTKVRIDEGWKLLAGSNPTDAKNTSYSDASWTTTNVPNDMSNALVGTSSSTDPGQKGWYRKHFTAPTGASGKMVIIQFDGVYHDAVVYINGSKVASQEYGYVSFKADITKYLNLTGDNVLAVFVDNKTTQTSRWYSGSGIFRHVWMITTDSVHVKNWGTAITTPGAAASKSTVKINTEVTNETSASATRTLVTVICDSTGKRIDSVSTPITVAANTTTKFSQSIDINNPSLWSPDNPYVYNAYTKIMNGTTLADDYVTPFGIRNITYSTSGFFINGVNTKMKGICMHHTMVPVGSAVPEQIWVRVIKELKASGTNSIRTSHAPMAPEFYDLCDNMGMLVMDEWCDKWKDQWAGSYYQDWDNVWKADLTLFLERDRNHPSIYIWSYGNEVATSASGGAMPQYEYDMSGTIVPFAKAIDSSRPYTHAVVNGFSADWSGYVKLAQYEDIVGVNYNDGGYATGISDGPNVVWIGTEQYPYGTTWNNCKNKAQVFGEHIWTGMDYLGEVTPMGENSGFLDVCAFRKTWFYYRKSIIGSDPVVKLGVGSTSTSGGAWVTPTLSESWNQSGSQNVVAYSNCQSVSLYLNGTLVGTKTYSSGTPSVSQWTVTWASGTLKVVGSNSGTQVAVDSLITVGSASKLVIESDRTTLYADGDDVANIDVYITDANGNHVWNATNTITYSVSGNGRGYGIGTGDLTKASNFSGSSHAAYEGRAYLPVQSTTTPGTITVSATASGLTAGSIVLTTIAQPTGGTRVLNRTVSGYASPVSFTLKTGLHSVKMDYRLEKESQIRISVFLPSGRMVGDFDEGIKGSGLHSWTCKGITKGNTYFFRLKADGRSFTRLMIMP